MMKLAMRKSSLALQKLRLVKSILLNITLLTMANFNKLKREKVDAFVSYLESKNLIVNVRRSRGKDIDAACGQLANKLVKS